MRWFGRLQWQHPIQPRPLPCPHPRDSRSAAIANDSAEEIIRRHNICDSRLKVILICWGWGCANALIYLAPASRSRVKRGAERTQLGYVCQFQTAVHMKRNQRSDWFWCQARIHPLIPRRVLNPGLEIVERIDVDAIIISSWLGRLQLYGCYEQRWDWCSWSGFFPSPIFCSCKTGICKWCLRWACCSPAPRPRNRTCPYHAVTMQSVRSPQHAVVLSFRILPAQLTLWGLSKLPFHRSSYKLVITKS